MDKNEIIFRVSYIRNRANISQKALSFAIKKNAGYINRLECTKSFLPSMETLLDIIRECGSTVEEFFYYSIQAFEEDKPLLSALRKQKSKEKRQAILTLLD